MFNSIKQTFSYGQHQVTLETGVIARQADAAVLASMGDTVVLSTCVFAKEANENFNFFPLTVDYQEKTYSAGKIPGGFFKREGRPSEKEILTSRLIDRPLRPLFPKWFINEVQVVSTVLSLDPEIDPDIVAMLGSAAAVRLSGLPIETLAAVRVVQKDGSLQLSHAISETKASSLDLVVAGTASSILMVESEAKELSEATMLDALDFGHKHIAEIVQSIDAFVQQCNRPAMTFQPPDSITGLEDAVSQQAKAAIENAYKIVDKLQRRSALDEILDRVLADLAGEEKPFVGQEKKIKAFFAALSAATVRKQILLEHNRIDGRKLEEIRSIDIRVGVLPRTHGSALFTRGETQALVVASLGTGKDAQIIDAIEGERKEPFMLHYNFPPYCVGEMGRMGIPKRREIGHGRLAKRSMIAVMPDMAEYPYSIRVVSEITESNGSSSMASVCGSSLALMDAGVEIKAPVAGIAMGLIKEEAQFAVLSDIMGDEDHLGDMDFKVAGTTKGITALQMDIKVDGVNREIMEKALSQAKDGRLHILEAMNRVLSEPRKEMSEFAPRITTLTVTPDKIRDIIGKGGAVIRAITEETGAIIDIDDSGLVKIAATSGAASEAARKRIEDITAKIEVGKIYEGIVQKIMDFGAFVNILPGKDGLVHISQLSSERVERVTDKVKEGETVKVKVLEIDKLGRVRLSMKAAVAEEEEAVE